MVLPAVRGKFIENQHETFMRIAAVLLGETVKTHLER